MIIVLKKIGTDQLGLTTSWLMGLHHYSQGVNTTIMGLVGDTRRRYGSDSRLGHRRNATRIQEPYKNANRKFHPKDTIVSIPSALEKSGAVKIGGGNFQIIAGPCSVEGEDQVCQIAEEVKDAGVKLYRGGAFKPRTSPYAFQGMRQTGIQLLEQAKARTGLPVVTEVMDISHLPLFENVDVIRSEPAIYRMQLLKELGTLKTHPSQAGTLQHTSRIPHERRIHHGGGNSDIILCERDRTFETATRNTLDLSAVPLLKTMTHLPVIVDPSHATGIASLVLPMALAATAAERTG